MGYVDKSNRMANSYSITWRTFKWTKKLFFHLLDLTILNSWILLSTCGAKYSQRDFRFLMVRNMIDETGKLGCLHSHMVGIPSQQLQNWIVLQSGIASTGQKEAACSAATFVRHTECIRGWIIIVSSAKWDCMCIPVFKNTTHNLICEQQQSRSNVVIF
jgi:hypothetical protein